MRAYLVLLCLALGTGYAAGLLHGVRTLDRSEPAGPGDGARAREALAALRAAAKDERTPPESLAVERDAFLTTWPDSWLRAHWEGRGR